MKMFLCAFLLLCSTPVVAEPSARFVSPSGCIWKEGHGTCMVSNVFKITINCDVTTKVKTMAPMGGWLRPMEHVKHHKISIPPKMTDSTVIISAPDGQKMTGVQISAVCTT